ncbi:hypothetical protein SDC9_163242 [bioreactor metagenome]|uniref:Uncharacterized protein n=1 Tax=bioreactor metagenome TaxID=1076179 RepID=A0A645FQD4_9ZZZZ
MRKTNPQIKLILILPCLDRDKDWALEQKGDFALISIMCDEIIYTDEAYYEGCLFRRNCRLVNDSSVCIAYCKHSGQSEFTSRSARLHGLEVINLAD